MRKIAFVCSEPSISGGANVIFRHAMELARNGITVAIVCKTPVIAAHIGWHPIAEMADHPNVLWLDHNEALSHRFDLAIATWWRTFFDLWKVQADRYAYFVQSIESRFYPLEERVVRAAVDATYEAPLGIITEARWIRDYFQRLYGRDAALAPNGIDKAIFTEIGDVISPRSPGRLRILVEGALEASFKNVPASIWLAREGGADEIWLLTPSAADTVEGVDRVFSRIAQAQVASVYRSCDVILKLSLVEGMFGPPLEMFHCGGTAIVYNVTGHDEFIVHGHNALVAERHDEAAVVRFIRQLKDFPPFQEALKANARDTAAQWPDWPAATAQFRDAMERAAAKASFDRDMLGQYSRRIWTLVEGSRRQPANDALKTELSAAKTELSAELSAAKTELSAAQVERDVLRQQFEAVVNSTTWKSTYPIRQLGARHTKIARLLRIALKLGWWSARLQLRSRLREARQRRLAALRTVAQPLEAIHAQAREPPETISARAPEPSEAIPARAPEPTRGDPRAGAVL